MNNEQEIITDAVEKKGIFSSATKIVLLLITIAVIWMTWMWIEVTEPLKNLSIMVFSFYFGQKTMDNKK